MHIERIAFRIFQYEAVAFIIEPVAASQNFLCLNFRTTRSRISIYDRTLGIVSSRRRQRTVAVIDNCHLHFDIARIRHAVSTQIGNFRNRISVSLTSICLGVQNRTELRRRFAGLFIRFGGSRHRNAVASQLEFKGLFVGIIPIATLNRLNYFQINLAICSISVRDRTTINIIIRHVQSAVTVIDNIDINRQIFRFCHARRQSTRFLDGVFIMRTRIRFIVINLLKVHSLVRIHRLFFN